jgi:hypothetical protein
MDKEKMIEDIISMLDNGVQNGEGHINVKMEENQQSAKQVVRGCSECSVNATACSIPTSELPGDEDYQK